MLKKISESHKGILNFVFLKSLYFAAKRNVFIILIGRSCAVKEDCDRRKITIRRTKALGRRQFPVRKGMRETAKMKTTGSPSPKTPYLKCEKRKSYPKQFFSNEKRKKFE